MKKQYIITSYNEEIKDVLCKLSDAQSKYLPMFKCQGGHNIFRYDISTNSILLVMTYKKYKEGNIVMPAKNCLYVRAINLNNAIKVLNRLINSINENIKEEVTENFLT